MVRKYNYTYLVFRNITRYEAETTASQKNLTHVSLLNPLHSGTVAREFLVSAY